MDIDNWGGNGVPSFSVNGADAETVPIILLPKVVIATGFMNPMDIDNWGGNAIVLTPVLQRIFANYNHIIVIVIESSVHKSLQ